MTLAGLARAWVREGLADAIRRARRRAGLSRAQLGAAAGLSAAQLGRIERGDVAVPLAIVYRLAAVLGGMPSPIRGVLVELVSPGRASRARRPRAPRSQARSRDRARP